MVMVKLAILNLKGLESSQCTSSKLINTEQEKVKQCFLTTLITGSIRILDSIWNSAQKLAFIFLVLFVVGRINPFHGTDPFLYPLKTSKHLRVNCLSCALLLAKQHAHYYHAKGG